MSQPPGCNDLNPICIFKSWVPFPKIDSDFIVWVEGQSTSFRNVPGNDNVKLSLRAVAQQQKQCKSSSNGLMGFGGGKGAVKAQRYLHQRFKMTSFGRAKIDQGLFQLWTQQGQRPTYRGQAAGGTLWVRRTRREIEHLFYKGWIISSRHG